MLIFIGISVGVTIIVLIIFHFVLAVINAAKNGEEEDASLEDEMDKLINLKSARVSSVFFGLGFIASLVSLVLQFPPAVMLNIMFGACFLGSFFEGLTQLFYYRRGVKNG
ncbi:MAG: hypothetical protein EHM28_10650 [Spirochaetaceae bacterium]|nr:MAG: hypothetical protein EHM28_10650 [Spirochaetaceae bacterium]